MFVLFIVFMIAGVAASALTTMQAALTWLFRRRSFFDPPLRREAASEDSFPPAVFTVPRPFVSILKPVCGLDDELALNLESFTRIRGVNHEIVISVAQPSDPALIVIEELRRRHPTAPFRVVVGGDPRYEDGNRKVARLIAASRVARGDVLFISDSNVRVEPSDIAATIRPFAGGRVGCVSNLFTGWGAKTFGATMESLHLLSFVMPGNVLADAVHVPCVVGKSMAISRTALTAIGGFEAFAGVLAEDQAMALAATTAGFEVTLSPVVVRNVVIDRTFGEAINRQIRWNKIRYSFSKAFYTAEFLLNPWPLMMIATTAGLAAGVSKTLIAVPLLAIVLRAAQFVILADAATYPLTLRDIVSIPILDLLQFIAQFVPYFDNRVTWRGVSRRIGPNTILLREDEHLAA